MTASTIARPTNVRTSEPPLETPVVCLAPWSAGRFNGVSSPRPAASAVAGASAGQQRAAETAPEMKGAIRNGTDRLGRDESTAVIGRRADAFRTNVHDRT